MQRTSGIPICNRYRSRRIFSSATEGTNPAYGFTLLELLTVVVILGVLVSIIALHQSGADKSRQLRAEAERLMLAIEQARTETTMRNEIWAVHTTRESYGFTRLNEHDEWMPVGENPFQTITVGPDIVLSTRSVSRAFGEGKATEDPTRSPVVVLPSGEISPFEIVVELAFQDQSLLLHSDGISRVAVVDSRAASELRALD